MLILNWKVFICNELNLHIRVQHIKFIKKNTILKLRVSWADNCNNTETIAAQI